MSRRCDPDNAGHAASLNDLLVAPTAVGENTPFGEKCNTQQDQSSFKVFQHYSVNDRGGELPSPFKTVRLVSSLDLSGVCSRCWVVL